MSLYLVAAGRSHLGHIPGGQRSAKLPTKNDSYTIGGQLNSVNTFFSQLVNQESISGNGRPYRFWPHNSQKSATVSAIHRQETEQESKMAENRTMQNSDNTT